MDFRCTQCDVTFTMKHNLNRHMKNRCHNLVVVDTEISPSPPEPVVPFTLKTQFTKFSPNRWLCKRCDKTVSSQFKRKHYEQTCRGVLHILQCKYCELMCKNALDKSRHQKKCDQNPTLNNDATETDEVTFVDVDADHVKCLSCSKIVTKRRKNEHAKACRKGLHILQCKYCGGMCDDRVQKSRHQKKCDQNPKNHGDKGAAVNVDTTNRDIKTDDVSVQPKPKPNQHVYLIQEREFVKTDEPVYKLGRSFKIKNRCGEYPKDSMIITILRVNDCVRAEKYLLSRFEQLFVKRTDIGCEYFEGDEDQMTDEVHNVKHHVY